MTLQYQSGTVASGALTGTERVSIDNGGAVNATCTTQQIAALANEEGNLSEVAIATVGNGTLTAAGLVAGQIGRTGPTAAFSDTFATAAQIVAALPGFVLGSTFFVRIKNGTIYMQTLLAPGGGGITLPANIKVPPFSAWSAFGTIGGTAAAPTIVFTHVDTALIYGSLTASPQLITPAGTTQAAATAITSLNVLINVNATASTRGIRLPVGSTGMFIRVGNGAAFGAKVWPGTNCKIGAAATNAADTTVLAVNKENVYHAVSATQWVVQRGA